MIRKNARAQADELPTMPGTCVIWSWTVIRFGVAQEPTDYHGNLPLGYMCPSGTVTRDDEDDHDPRNLDEAES